MRGVLGLLHRVSTRWGVVLETLQLDLYEATRPSKLTGAAAYVHWLVGYGFEVDGRKGMYAAVRSNPERLARLLPMKPCAASSDEFAQNEATFARARAEFDLGEALDAAPVLCED